MCIYFTLLSMSSLIAVQCFPYRSVTVDVGGSGNAFGNTFSRTDFKSLAEAENGYGRFTAGGSSTGQSLGGGDSNAFVGANGAIRDGPYLTSGAKTNTGSSAYGNRGSGSEAQSYIDSNGDLVNGRGQANSWGSGIGAAGAKSGSKIDAADIYGVYGASAGGSASGQGYFVDAASNSGTRVGPGSSGYSNNAASASGVGYSKATSNSQAASSRYGR